MSIFPFLDGNVGLESVEQKKELAVPKEYAWDFENNDFLFKDGKFVVVEGLEAIKIWLWKIFQTPRYRYLAYSWNYGHELENLLGKGLSLNLINAEAERIVKEAIWPTLNGYATNITNINAELIEGSLNINFTAITPYGEVEINV